jgi:ribosomal protein S18 acetylase RimI-like enzyme
MQPITVRRARSADLERLVPLFEGYRAFYKREPNEASAREFLSHRLAREDSVIIVAVDGTGKGAGFVQLYPVFSSLQMRPAWILNDLFVAPDYRGQHLSRTLMNTARDYAQKTGAASITLETAPENRTARALYESLGYKLEQSFLQYVLDLGLPRT